jgi:hypothetical protein
MKTAARRLIVLLVIISSSLCFPARLFAVFPDVIGIYTRALQAKYWRDRQNYQIYKNISEQRGRELRQIEDKKPQREFNKDWRADPRVAENGDIRGADNDDDGRVETIHVKGHIVRGHYAADGEKKYDEQPDPQPDGPRVAENGDIRGQDNDGDGEVEWWHIEKHYRKGYYRAAAE